MTVLDHGLVVQNTRQTTTSSSNVDVSGASISSTNFVPGKKYLLFFTALLDSTDTSKLIQVRVLAGGVQMPGCEHKEEPDAVTAKIPYFFWTVWTAVEDAGVKLQIRSQTGGFEVGIDEIQLKWFNLSDDLVENVDWFFQEKAGPNYSILSTSETDSENASVAVTPAVAGQRWLVLGKSELEINTDLSVSVQTRLLRTGEATETLSELIKEGGDESHVYIMSHLHVLTLGAVANTFTEKSLLSGFSDDGTERRLTSSIFLLNLSRFKHAASARTLAKTDLSDTNFGTQLESVAITPSASGPVWSQGFWVHDLNAVGISGKTRLQVNNADDPAGQTANAFPQDQGHDARDQVGLIVGTLSTKAASLQTYDLDASTSAALAGRGGLYRSLFAVTMELADAGDPEASGEVTYVGSVGFTGTETTGGNLTIPDSGPLEVQEFDELIIEVTSRNHHAGIAFVTVTDSNAANPWSRRQAGYSRKSYVFRKKVTPADVGLVVTIAGAQNSCAAHMHIYRGAWRGGDPISDISGELNLGSESPKIHAGFTPAHANSMICAMVSNHTNDVAVTGLDCANPATLTARSEVLSTGGDDCAIAHASAPQVGGPFATGDLTWPGTANENTSAFYAIRPEPSAVEEEEPAQTEALCKPVAFNVGTGLAGSTVPVEVVGFPPKAILFMAVGRAETGDAGGNGTAQRMLGFAADCAGTLKNRCAVSSSVHNQAAPNFLADKGIRNDACIAILDSTGNFAGRARVSSLTATGFVLTIDQQFASDLRVVAEVYGGSDITDCAIGTIVTPTSGAAPVVQDITNLGFTCVDGQFVVFLIGTGQTADNVVPIDAQLSFGAFTKARDGVFWTGAAANDLELTVTRRHCSRGRPWQSLSGSAQSFAKLIAVDSLITGGFRLHHDRVSASAERIYYLVIKGGRWGLGEGFTSTQFVEVPVTGVGIGKPVGGLLVSANSAAEQTEDRLNTTDMGCFGMFSSPTDRYVMAFRDQDNEAVSRVATRVEHDQCWLGLSNFGEASSSLDFERFDGDGVTFRQDSIEEDANFASQRYFWCVLFARRSGFTGDAGSAHLFWRFRPTIEPGAGPAVNQLEVDQRIGEAGGSGSTAIAPAKLHLGATHFVPVLLCNWPNTGSPNGEVDFDLFVCSLPPGHVPDLPGDDVKQEHDTLFDSDGVLLPHVGIGENGKALPLVKGKIFGRSRHNDPITFADHGRTFLTVPKFTVRDGYNNQPEPLWGTIAQVEAGTAAGAALTKGQRPLVGGKDLTESGCKIIALLEQTAAVPTMVNHTLDFPHPNPGTTNLFNVGDVAVITTLTGLVATVQSLDVHVFGADFLFSNDGRPFTRTYVYVVETSITGGLGVNPWQIRASNRMSFTTTSRVRETLGPIAAKHQIFVPGMSGDGLDQVRVRIVAIEERGTGVSVIGGIDASVVFWSEFNHQYASKTPFSGDFVDWEAEGYV